MVNHYNIFLDDCRSPTFLKDIRTWEVVRNYQEFIKLITERGIPEFISFDHDLSYQDIGKTDYNIFKEKTGYHCALFLIKFCEINNLKLLQWQVHSLNLVGKKNIEQLLKKYESNKHYT